VADASERWERGLRETNQSPERMKYLDDATTYRIYTPGASAGFQVSVLGELAPPKPKLKPEALAHKINATTSALLGLTGTDIDPVQSREFVFVAKLLEHAWTTKDENSLAALVHYVAPPPRQKVGAYNLDSFIPSKDRIRFAALLKHVLALPTFTLWTECEPLDLACMLDRERGPEKRRREFRLRSRHELFPQVYALVERYV